MTVEFSVYPHDARTRWRPCALGALLKVQRLARQSGGDVLLAAPVAIVLRLLSLTGMDEVFGVRASADAAVASIAGRPAGRAERAGCRVAGALALSGSWR